MIQQLISDELTRRGRGAKAQLAAAVGVAPTTVTKWIQGEVSPDRARLPAIETALGFPAGSLLAAGGYQSVPSESWSERVAALEERLAELERRMDGLESDGQGSYGSISARGVDPAGSMLEFHPSIDRAADPDHDSELADRTESPTEFPH